MAIRIENCSDYPLRLDMQGGEVLTLPPRQTSVALREEAFYDNVYVRDWLAKGIIRVLDAPMSEVREREMGPAADEAAQAADAEADQPATGDEGAADGGGTSGSRRRRKEPK